MPEFDPKNIPVLDDIIDDDSADTDELDDSETENNLDLFEQDETESATETESQINTIDTTDNPVDIDTTHKNFSQFAVKFDYEEIYSGLVFRLDGAVKDEQSEDNVRADADSATMLEPLALEPIVESVVKQMMPDLEQQLRFLIQQALEKRLPSEIIKSTGTETDDDSTAMD